MSAPTTHTSSQRIIRSKKLSRRFVAFGDGKRKGAERAEGYRPKLNRVALLTPAMFMSLIVVMSALPQTTPMAAVRGQHVAQSNGSSTPEGRQEAAKNFTRLQGPGDKGTLSNFARLRERLTAGLLGFEPEELRMLGQRDAGGRLKDWSPAAIAEEVKFCREGIRELNAAVVESPDEVLDRAVLISNLTYLAHYYGRYHGELGNLHISVSPYELIQYELHRFAIGDRTADDARAHFGAVEGVLRGLPRYLEQQQSNLLAGLKLRSPDKEILEHIMERIGWPGDKRSIRAGLHDIEQRLESAEPRASLPALAEGRTQATPTGCGSGLQAPCGLYANKSSQARAPILAARPV